jgi:protein-tyrosine phosphatase
MLDLVTPAPAQLRDAAAAIEAARGAGPVLVCCALGFSRSAATIATWLVATRRAATVDEAVELVRRARPRIVLDAAACAAIAAAVRL